MNTNTVDSKSLVDCAMGRLPADIVIQNGRWVCVQTGEIIPDTDIAILGQRIAYVGADASHTIGANTVVMDAAGRYLTPGLLDGHMHVESGMLTVTEFVRAVLPRGTTGMFIDPHEIANVFGLDGVRLMVDEAAQQPIHVFVQMPSCVPSSPEFETPGASIGPVEVAEAMTWTGVIGLGEVMNYPGVSNGDDKMHAEMDAARQANKIIGGHYASPDLGLPFHAYAAAGPQDDHEGTSLDDAIARARQGMRVMMRQGSAWHDVATMVKAVTEMGLDPRMFILCTDDSHSHTLVYEGHMDRVVRLAISQGVKPVTAIQMATINTAEYFGLSRHMGMIAPGRFADVLLVDDLANFYADTVIARGQVVAHNGALFAPLPEITYPDWSLQSVHLKQPLTAADFCLASERNPRVTANVIGVIENQAPTKHVRLELAVQNGEVHADLENDIAKVALVERHHASGDICVGLVQGFGFCHPCAVATTVAHDCHNMIVVGTDDANMALAANTLAESGGGQVVVLRGEVIGQVRLPIGGIIANENATLVAQQAATVLAGFEACGCTLNNPNMQLSLLGLVVIPSLRISDRGLVDVSNLRFLPVLE